MSRVLKSALALLLATSPWTLAQSSAPRLEFEVASVRQNKTGGKSSMNVSPTSGPDFVPTGGLYSAKNIVLAQFIAFAYTLSNKQLQAVIAQAPWTTEDQFDIEARAAVGTTKDQFRLMMQSLLADRFKLAVHFETRQVPIYALVFTKEGRLGPSLRLHQPNDPACAAPPGAVPSPIPTDPAGFPLVCGSNLGMQPSAPGRMKSGGRDVSLAQFAAITAPGVGAVDRPVTDKTGLQGNVDYTLEWQQVAANVRPGREFHPDESAPPFGEALKEQLGLKLVPDKGPVEFFVVDHIEHPSEN